MENKFVLGIALVAVLGIGIVGLLNLDSYTGMTLLENSYCHCYGYLTDHAGNPIETFSQNVRVPFQSLSEAQCNNVCSEHFHRNLVIQGMPVGPGEQ